MPVDINNDLSYEYLTLCIQEYEEAALKSNTRSGYMAVSYGTTYSIDSALEAQQDTLSRISTTRDMLANKEKGLQLVDVDADLAELFGNDDSAFANYLTDCLGCNLRLKFDWQLQPIDFLGPIHGFLDQINATLDRLESRIDPYKLLSEICKLLNMFKDFCPQDIIIVFLSLKMLLKKYLLQMFSIRLDWTVILGPIIKAIVSAITDLLSQLFAILMAPIDCALAAMRSARAIEMAAKDLLNTIDDAATQISDFSKHIKENGHVNTLLNEDESGLLYKDISWTNEGITDTNNIIKKDINPGSLSVSMKIDPLSKEKEIPNKEDSSTRVLSGFVLKNDMTIEDALKDPLFANTSIFDKIIIPVQEAQLWLKELYNKFIGSIKSLEGLVGGGLSLNLDKLGILTFILDMISLVSMIIKMLNTNAGVNDWCSYLKEHPEVLEKQLNTISRGATVVPSKDSLIVMQNSIPVGIIQTCVSNRTQNNSSIINQWILDLEGA